MNSNGKKRSLTLILLALMLASTACGGGSGETASTTAAQGNANAATEETTASVASLIGFDKEDNNGKTFTILENYYYAYEYDAETLTGDVVNDAVYEKNMAVEDYLGIELNIVLEEGNWPQKDTFNNKVSSAVLAGDDSYDMVSSSVVITTSLAKEGLFIEGQKLPYMNLDNPWWIANQYGLYAISGKLYGFFGDASLSVYKDMNVIYFNKRIWEDNKIGDPYEWVRNNTWTFDKFLEVGSSMAQDLDGDGTYDYEKDQISYLGENVPQGTLQQSLEIPIVEIQSDGSVKYLGLSEKFAECYEKMGTFMALPGVGSVSSIDDQSFKSMKYFANGNVATMANFLYATEYFRDMEDDYGIIPMPKYDEEQEKYTTRLGTSTTMMYVPKTQSDRNLCSKTMEALCYFTRQLVVPKYYETALKEKYSRDADVAEMLDLIRDGAMIDFESVYSIAISPNMSAFFRFYNTDPNAGTFSNTLASTFASQGETYEENIKKMEEAYAEIVDD